MSERIDAYLAEVTPRDRRKAAYLLNWYAAHGYLQDIDAMPEFLFDWTFTPAGNAVDADAANLVGGQPGGAGAYRDLLVRRARARRPMRPLEELLP